MGWAKTLVDAIFRHTEKIEEGFIAEIVTFNKKTMRAEIKPLLEYTTEARGKSNKRTIETPNIPNVPCDIHYAGGFFIRPDYKKGDLVDCALKASNISKPLDSGIRADTGNNRYSLSYCTVTNGVIPKNFTFPTAWDNEDGLLIGKDDSLLIQILDGTIKTSIPVSLPGAIRRMADVRVGRLDVPRARWGVPHGPRDTRCDRGGERGDSVARERSPPPGPRGGAPRIRAGDRGRRAPGLCQRVHHGVPGV